VRKLLAAVAALFIGVFVLSACSSVNTAPDQVSLHYKGGPIESTKFSACVDPSTRSWDGPGDKHFTYPAGQRTFEFSANETSRDAGRVSAPDVNGVELLVSGTIRFELNTDCDTLRQFHEKIGLKSKAYMQGDSTSDGWREMLGTYMQQPLQRAVNDATQLYDWKDLYSDSSTKAEWEKSVKDLLPKYVEQAMGDDYFNDFSVTVQKPDLPETLTKAIVATQEAIEQNKAQEQRNATVQTELESIRALVEVLGPDGYNTYQAIKDGKINVVAIPQGSDLVVNPQVPADK
jgi:hypothetical protein